MADTVVDSLLENLEQLMDSDIRFILDEKDQMEYLYKELGGILRNFLKDSEEKRYEHAKVKILVTQIRDVALEAQNIIDFLVAGKTIDAEDIADYSVIGTVEPKRRVEDKISQAFNLCHHMLRDIIEEIKSITEEVREIYDKKLYGIGVPQVGMSSHETSLSRANPPHVDEETVVGFEHEAETIKEQLTGLPKRLQVVSIVGMAGLGKTTLARKLYNDPYIAHYFYIRGWTYVSQTYRKRDLLLNILSFVVEHNHEIFAKGDEMLRAQLYRCLKGKRYFIVIDDIWNVDAWDYLKKSFPNDNNGSRVLFTSRLKEVALHANPGSHPHFLPFLTEDESWDMLRLKVFWKKTCPPELMEIGRQITKKCQGLPLAIVVVAGLLANTSMTQDWWKQVAESIGSYIISDPKHCMDTLALSYNHLPHYLKPCFLYFGAFPEDYEIPSRKLTWLWVAEGFIQKIGGKSLEDVAEEYLMDLVDRSLVSIAKRGSTGRIKTCRVHDLLRDLCLKKAKEEDFRQHIYGYEESHSSCFCHLLHDLFLKKAEEMNSLQQIYRYGKHRLCIHSSSSSSTPTANKEHQLGIHSYLLDYIFSTRSAPQICSFLWFATDQRPLLPKYMPFNFRFIKFLRVLDFSAITMDYFPYEIVQLVLLRYLALRGKKLSIPDSIASLWNLETLVISEGEGSDIPPSLWCMKKLRHLHMAGVNHIRLTPAADSILYNLQTISQVDPSLSCRNILAITPNLRKLGFCATLSFNRYLSFPNLDFLNHLESLKLLHRNDRTSNASIHYYGNRFETVKFPPNLKRLTLSLTSLYWEEMSIIGILPNLEALRLEYNACSGQLWETSDGEFRKLKYLKLHYMNIEQWNASSAHFPNLQRLVLHKCEKLKEIPTELGYIPTLQRIDVSWCSHSTANSARRIHEEQQSNGNDCLQISINPSDWELPTCSSSLYCSR